MSSTIAVSYWTSVPSAGQWVGGRSHDNVGDMRCLIPTLLTCCLFAYNDSAPPADAGVAAEDARSSDAPDVLHAAPFATGQRMHSRAHPLHRPRG